MRRGQQVAIVTPHLATLVKKPIVELLTKGCSDQITLTLSGQGSFVGSGSTIKQGVVIGKRCVIGMAVSVRHNQSDHTRYVGREQG